MDFRRRNHFKIKKSHLGRQLQSFVQTKTNGSGLAGNRPSRRRELHIEEILRRCFSAGQRLLLLCLIVSLGLKYGSLTHSISSKNPLPSVPQWVFFWLFWEKEEANGLLWQDTSGWKRHLWVQLPKQRMPVNWIKTSQLTKIFQKASNGSRLLQALTEELEVIYKRSTCVFSGRSIRLILAFLPYCNHQIRITLRLCQSAILSRNTCMTLLKVS